MLIGISYPRQFHAEFFGNLAKLVSKSSGVKVEPFTTSNGDQILACMDEFPDYAAALETANKIKEIVIKFVGITGDVRVSGEGRLGPWKNRDDLIIEKDQEIASLRRVIANLRAGIEDEDIPF